MKGFLLAASGLLLMFASLAVPAQEMSVRNGAVTGIAPIQVQAPRSSNDSGGSRTGGALKRAFSRFVGRTVANATGDYSTANAAMEIAEGASEDVTSSDGGNGGTTTAYMVMIKFDDGNESAIRSASVDKLRVGSRVKVFGSGGSARIVAVQ